ncbi:hypothetical protein EG359_11375 [Chryseobacterium joostei]|uniref:DUF6705 domain-containing protein n=1 Tax=Chryseobacterium joostei TaxID=112234 RepID=A0A1N7IHB7_9FLAO|nr:MULTISPECIES: DUF6705 family protein [Chryseobacterium]AZB00187.1 hypothetical protein EG359_11375 [Chryseobacterium joostei]SIS36351.1 hypothetical protein SAMN05421768_105195 [Chryseobacterium joostei]HCM33834.1 hypothetical protein [Chryseobacterium sp.]
MNKLLLIFTFFYTIACNAQEYPLKTDHTEVPNYSYLKDTKNELDSFVGTWKANYNNNTITLYITKEIHKPFGGNKYYKDVLSIKYIVKNSAGNILQNTQNMTIQSNQLRHTIFSQWAEDNGNLMLFYYGGTNCSVGWGKIFLKKINPTQISWEYRPNDIILDDSKCPPGTDINIYLPETKDLIFTKQ